MDVARVYGSGPGGIWFSDSSREFVGWFVSHYFFIGGCYCKFMILGPVHKFLIHVFSLMTIFIDKFMIYCSKRYNNVYFSTLEKFEDFFRYMESF